MELICDNCEKIFQRARPKKTKYKFCCKDCHKLWRKNKIKTNKCKFCGKDTTNPAFCCKSCAASYNNKEFPKRRKEKKITDKKNLDKRYPIYVDWDKITLGDIVYTADQVKSNRYTRVRDHAKRVYATSKNHQCCAHCGYSKHFEICHIKPIYMFDLITPISVINSLDNLVALCPNCHWEFDNGLILVPLRGLEPRT